MTVDSPAVRASSHFVAAFIALAAAIPVVAAGALFLWWSVPIEPSGLEGALAQSETRTVSRSKDSGTADPENGPSAIGDSGKTPGPSVLPTSPSPPSAAKDSKSDLADQSLAANSSASSASTKNPVESKAEVAGPAKPPPPWMVESPGSANRLFPITFDDIKFEMKKEEPWLRSMLTKEIEGLEGVTIRIKGFILPGFQQNGITSFVLVRDNLECCFGPGAALFDCIMVEMDEGKSTNFTVRPITVEGVFQIKPLIGPDGKHLAIYALQARSAK